MAEENLVHHVALPPGAAPPIRVFVNGEPRAEGTDFAVEGDTLRFTPPLRAQPHLSFGRKVLLAIGIGVYGDLKGDTLDVQYRGADGEPRSATIPLRPAAAGGSRPG